MSRRWGWWLPLGRVAAFGWVLASVGACSPSATPTVHHRVLTLLDQPIAADTVSIWGDARRGYRVRRERTWGGDLGPEPPIDDAWAPGQPVLLDVALPVVGAPGSVPLRARPLGRAGERAIELRRLDGPVGDRITWRVVEPPGRPPWRLTTRDGWSVGGRDAWLVWAATEAHASVELGALRDPAAVLARQGPVDGWTPSVRRARWSGLPDAAELAARSPLQHLVEDGVVRVDTPLPLELSAAERQALRVWVQQARDEVGAGRGVFSAVGGCGPRSQHVVAAARAEGWDAEQVHGLAYVPEPHAGLWPHTWVELTSPAGRVVPVDPGLGRVVADAARLVLARGEPAEASWESLDGLARLRSLEDRVRLTLDIRHPTKGFPDRGAVDVGAAPR